ncbi:hypothetical protein CEW88_23420 (plasmid) [Alloyangia pacifica]|uniref:Heparinase II/III-like C-terminal domain-containing protein n=1 Tax=Alloyangia pacifica TaxID=311180 RepID=A0A2U8HLQ3_9RHOB|nr:heparinase II/III family protein [Alloyangia pacifica]AWI86718.1 hypothetical protein CEW88_23420 [Alloyangia pacifica]
MSRLDKIRVMALAVSRLSPRMCLFMGRRVLRNKLAPRFPDAYARRLARIEQDLPAIGMPQALSPGLLGMAEFYCAEYRHMLEGALEGRITLHGRCVDFGAPGKVDWTHVVPEEGDHQMWRVKLGHMGFLCPMMLEGGPAHHNAVGTYVRTSAGIRPGAPGTFRGFWFPYGASHRVLSVGSGLLVCRHRAAQDTAPALPEAVDQDLAALLRRNVAFILDNIEHELCNNHVERNLAALCLYFSHVDRVPAEIATRLERDIAALLDATLLDDGCQIERSPMYQGLSLASLGVMAEAPFLSAALRARLAASRDRVAQVFAALCLPDGEVALFNDAWHGEVPHWTGPPAPDGRILLPDGGYGRLGWDGDVCLMDAGALGPRWNPGHGHADFLSVEIALAGRRLVVDPGTSRYNTGPERERERSAAAHNGPIWQGHEPVDFYGCFKVGRMAAAILTPAAALPDDQTMQGRFRDGPGTLSRTVRQFPGQGFLVIDQWSAPQPAGQVTWLIPGTWHRQDAAPSEAPAAAAVLALRHEDGTAAWIEVLSPVVSSAVTADICASHYGHVTPAHALTLHPEADRGHLITWIGHAAPEPLVHAEAARLLDGLGALS